jgi:hypothetical protein
MVDGEVLVNGFALVNEEVAAITADARRAAATLAAEAGVR